jgi:hypothetical protein
MITYVQTIPPEVSRAPIARARLCAFYRSSDDLVAQQLAQEFEADLSAAVRLVQAVEDDDWSW